MTYCSVHLIVICISLLHKASTVKVKMIDTIINGCIHVWGAFEDFIMQSKTLQKKKNYSSAYSPLLKLLAAVVPC